jgi:acyl-CoA synthetase (AMP-forming)/AMP-acid ligase II/acyl carrier protein
MTGLGTDTLVDILNRHAELRPNDIAYGFVAADGNLSSQLTYSDLLRRAEGVAAAIEGTSRPGDRAALLFPGGEEFVSAFFGCLIAGVIPVPGYPVRVPSSPTQPARNFGRLIPIFEDSDPKVVLTTEDVVGRRDELAAAAPAFAGRHWIAVEHLEHARPRSLPKVSRSDVAFLQYTSGSTSAPKGVMVTHDNLMTILRDMDVWWEHGPDSVMVTWIPVYHDLGLIYGIMQPLHSGFPCYSLMPASVLQHPKRWLQAISRFRGTHSCAPNFAFDLCTTRIPDAAKAELDLSCWRMGLNGAEPVRHQTIQRFNEAFAACGLSPLAMKPSYGLAEATLTVSSYGLGEESRTVYLDAAESEAGRVVLRSPEDKAPSRSFVSCGWVHGTNDVRIVDPETGRECPPDRIGEIWVRGPIVTAGYWRNEEASEDTMRARVAGGEGGYLRTGDLGFLVDGHLYIAGRIKDVVIIRGRNLYPQDIEETLEAANPAVRLGRCGAFSVDAGGNEALVVVAELDRFERHSFDAEGAFADLRHAVSTNHEIELYDAVFVRTGTFPLTSSGKVQRSRAKREYLGGQLQVVARMREPDPAIAAEAAPSNTEEKGISMQNELRARRAELVRVWIAAYASRRLKTAAEGVPVDLPFEKVGFDSMSLIEMTADIEEIVGLELAPSIVFEYPTIATLADRIAELSGLDPAEIERRMGAGAAPAARPDAADEQTGLQAVV